MTRSTAFMMLAWWLAAIGTGGAQEPPTPEQVFEQVYGPQYELVTKSTTTVDDVALARDLVEAAKRTPDTPGLVALLCTRARELAERDREGEAVAVASLETLAELVPAERGAAMDKLASYYHRQYLRARGEERGPVGQRLIRTFEAAAAHHLRTGNAAEALALYRKASGIARAIRADSSGLDEAIAQTAARMRAMEQIEKYKQLLRAKKSPEIAERLVMSYVVDLDAPEEARKYTFLLTDEALTEQIRLASVEPTKLEPPEMQRVGAWYKRLGMSTGGSTRQWLLRRAASYLELAAERMEGAALERVKSEVDLTAALRAVADSAPRKDPPDWVKGCVLALDFESDSVQRRGNRSYFADRSGSGHDARNVGVKRAAGRIGDAAEFTGDSGHLHVTPFKLGGPITIAAWVRHRNPTAEWSRLMDFGNGPDADNIVIAWQDTSAKPWFYTWHGDKGTDKLSHKTPTPADQWMHVLVVVGADGDGRLMVNGKTVDTDTVSVPRAVVRQRQYFGRSNWSDVSKFTGLMDEIAIWERALEPAEAGRLYQMSAEGKSYVDVIASSAGTIVLDFDESMSDEPEAEVRPLQRRYLLASAEVRQRLAPRFIDQMRDAGAALESERQYHRAALMYERAQRLAEATRSDQLAAVSTAAVEMREMMRVAAQMAELERRVQDGADAEAARTLAALRLIYRDAPQEAAALAGRLGGGELAEVITLAQRPTKSLSASEAMKLAEFYEARTVDVPSSVGVRLLTRAARAYRHLHHLTLQSQEPVDDIVARIIAIDGQVAQWAETLGPRMPDLLSDDALALRYTFDDLAAIAETPATTVADASGNDHAARLATGAVIGRGVAGGGLDLTTAGYLNAGNAVTIKRRTAFTASAWVRPTEVRRRHALFGCRSGASPYRGWAVKIERGHLRTVLCAENNKSELDVSTGEIMAPGRWQHLVVTYDGSSKAAGVRVYVDGAPVEITAAFDTLSGAIDPHPAMQIGAAEGTDRFEGQIDDVRLYERVLTPAEVQSLYERRGR